MTNPESSQPLTGFAFPIIVVKFHGPTNSRGSRYSATLRRFEGMGDGVRTLARVVVPYDYVTGTSELKMRAALACWDKYAGADNLDNGPRVLVPADMPDANSTGYVVMPAHMFGATA